jgi:hypothetical protein
MTADDALLFIDAQIYLDLYRIPSGKQLLAPLSEQSERIFVTQQVVNEVTRNKIEVAASFLSTHFPTLKLNTFKVPDHLFGQTEGESKTIVKRMGEISTDIGKLNQAIFDLTEGIMDKIGHSTDAVSMTLDPIFSRAKLHTDDELRRAKNRRELGNPPGKKTDPLGDQLNWEQILSQLTPKSKLWIISRDGDYGSTYGGRLFLNKFLYDELRKGAPNAEAFLFRNIVDGIKDFTKATGVDANTLPTAAEEAEIKKEIEALPPPIVASAGTFFSNASLTLPSASVRASAGNLVLETNTPGDMVLKIY